MMFLLRAALLAAILVSVCYAEIIYEHGGRLRRPGNGVPNRVHRALSGEDAGRSLQASRAVDWSLYRKTSQINHDLQDFAERNAHVASLDIMTSTSSDGQYSTTTRVVKIIPGGIRSGEADKMRVMIVFGEHARELITVEVAMRVLDMLADPLTAAQELELTEDDAKRLEATLAHTALTIIPMENVKGRTQVELGKACERKNGRGVDINRNYEVDWGVKEPDYLPSEEYPGKEALSEAESRLTLQLVHEFGPHAFVNVHSGMFAMFAPYDHKKVIPDDSNAKAQVDILHTIQEDVCDPGECLVGAGGATVGYLAHGTATDHMWVKEGIPFVSTWEIYGDENAAFSECYRMFNPTTAIGRDREVSRWARAVARLLLELPTHPGVPGEIARAIDGRLRATPAPPVPSGQAAGAYGPGDYGVPGAHGTQGAETHREGAFTLAHVAVGVGSVSVLVVAVQVARGRIYVPFLTRQYEGLPVTDPGGHSGAGRGGAGEGGERGGGAAFGRLGGAAQHRPTSGAAAEEV